MPILALLAAMAAQQTTCTAPLPAGLASWARPVPLAGGATLVIGTAARATLAKDATLAVAPEKPAPAGSFAGTFRFTVARAGTYRVSLGGPVWIDVIRGAERMASTAHGHGEQCSAIKKKVDFALAPGTYALQLSGAKTALVTVAIGPAT